ncbi:Uncharacterised protein [Neisseria meningitidis]|nr:Uncharacterised protein [Neisseria meningitidis]CWT73165.1 Uncharacterised protein [Neisseria meningitidis]
MFGELDGTVVVEVQAGYRPIGFGPLRFFFDGNGAEVFVKFNHAETFGVFDLISKHGCAVRLRCRLFQCLRKRLTVKNIVAQNQANIVVADKFFADDKCLCQAVRTGLHGITDGNAEIAAVAKQAFERGVVFRRGNHQNIADSRQHQNRQGVINHRFVVHGQELFGYAARDGVEARAAAACQYDAFHLCFLPLRWVFRRHCVGMPSENYFPVPKRSKR